LKVITMLIRILCATIAASCVCFEAWAAERAPVPADAIQQEHLKPIRNRYKSVFAGTDASNKKVLAEKLLKQARASEDQPTLMYVLLREAQRAAVGAGDADLAVATIEILGATFEIRTDEEKSAVLDELLGKTTSPQAKELISSISLSAARRLFEAGDYALTTKVLDVAKRATTEKSNNLAAITDLEKKTVAEIALDQKIDPFRQSLAANPDDARANYVVGRYECFYQGDWKAGLAKLAKCESVALRQLADATLRTTADAKSLATLAEQWWTTSELLKGREQLGAQAFSAALYRAALPDLDDDRQETARERVRRFVNAAGRAPPPLPFELQLQSGRTIDLVALVDPATDAKQGEWSKRGDLLTCGAPKFDSRVYIPYRPPAEYDLTVRFSQPKLNNPIIIFMSQADHSFACIAGGSEGRVAFTVETAPDAENPTARRARFKPDTEYRMVIQVRNEGVTALINGLELISHKTDYSDMKLGVFALDGNPPLAIGCDDVTVFHKLELLEISGRGRETRPANN
jgi:hypothetical protein